MDINIAICDDDRKIVDITLYKIIADANWKGNNIKIDIFYSGKTLIQKIKNGTSYDVIFMDIQLEDSYLGTDTGIIVKMIQPNTLIVYMSYHDGYFEDVVMAEPFSFLKKPLQQEELDNVVSLIINRLNYMNKSYLYSYKSEGIVNNVNLNDVTYFESKHRIVIIHMKNDSTFQFYKKLDIVEIEVEEIYPYFVRVNKSFYVNFFFIKSFASNHITMQNGEVFNITEKYKVDFIKKYTHFVQKTL